MLDNERNHKKNLGMLTGWRGSDFFKNGTVRRKIDPNPEITTERPFYAPTNRSYNEVFASVGVNLDEDGSLYQRLPAAVTYYIERTETLFLPRGQRIKLRYLISLKES